MGKRHQEQTSARAHIFLDVSKSSLRIEMDRETGFALFLCFWNNLINLSRQEMC